MHALLRISAVLFVLGLLTVGVSAILHALSPSLFLTENRRREELQLWREVIRQHRESQYQVVQDWIAQLFTLEETMQRFGELEQKYAQVCPPLRNVVQQSWLLSDEERHYLVILDRLHGLLHDRPNELTAVRRRLDKEYQQLRADRKNLGAAATSGRALHGDTIQESSSASPKQPSRSSPNPGAS